MPELIERFGVTSFKVFMFYGSHGPHGRSADQNAFLMIPEDERYDYAHFEFVMRGVQAARERFPELADEIFLSLHCETAEIMTAYTKLVEEAGELTGLAAYSASRPPHSEGLAVSVAAYLAHETGLPTINLLHLSSRKAVDAAVRMSRAFPHIDFRREVTVGHLLADITTAHGLGGKVNPPLRPRDDVEALWEYVLDGTGDRVVSDHACCREEAKFGEPKDDVFLARSGFRRSRVPPPRPDHRGHQARPVPGPDLGADLLEPGPPLRAAHQGNPRTRLRRRHRPGRPGPYLDRARRRVRVGAGVHPVRGLRADRPGHGHLPERPSHPADGQDIWRAHGGVPTPPCGWGGTAGGEPVGITAGR
ncbi:hypothetical protein QF035_001873 [Streptomyces umbrinus]|uniref:Uncharacterized protein n=1 Tax=Streptomyces umbrinus TaxID=67370 RepID=A0ABU0SL52_9ACTN|nr:hypothetical protein [Streptomyces umbrinus]